MPGDIEAGLSLSASAATAADRPYHLAVRGLPLDHFTVRSFRGREKLSGAYQLDIVVTCASAEEWLEHLVLGQPAVFVARLSLHVDGGAPGGATRAFGGVVLRVDALGARDHGRVDQVRIRLGPRLALLKRRRGSRIFQGLRVDQIVDAVCRAVGVKTEWRLIRPLPVRDYCTQYQESDYELIARLCAEAGIYFHFASDSAQDAALQAVLGGSTPLAAPVGDDALFRAETVIFGTDALFYPAILDGSAAARAGGAAPGGAANLVSPTLRYVVRQGTAAVREDTVSQLLAHSSLRATSAEFRDYDPARPHAPLVARAAYTPPDDPSTASALAGAVPHPRPESHALEVYDHRKRRLSARLET